MRILICILTAVACATCGAENNTTVTVNDPNGAQQASPSNNPNSTPSLTCPSAATDSSSPLRQQCVAKINAYRATLGLSPYNRWCGIATCVDSQASKDAAANSAHSAFQQRGEMAQDECPGWPTPESSSIDDCLAKMWAEGPGSDFTQHGHYINMSSPLYTEVECGFSASGSTFWSTQDFH